MLSLRMLGRVAPKTAIRPVLARGYWAVSRYNSLRPTWQNFQKPSYQAFSTSIARKEPAGEQDQLLAEKFNHERELELESRDTTVPPPEIEEWKQNSSWEILDKPGTNEIYLSRKFGNETIKVAFSITDMTDMAEEDFDDVDEDVALEDESYQQPKRTINQSGVKGGDVDVVAEDSIAPSDREGDLADGAVSYPINLLITISKPGNKVVEVRATAQDGTIDVDNILYLPEGESAADEDTSSYSGPPFDNLDTDLQVLFDQYLEERGVNTELATMLPALVDFKEQREYVEWLDRMKKFIEA